RTLMPHALAACHPGKLCTVRASENSTSGGSSETEWKELTVVPCSRPSGASVVATTMPVGNTPRVLRNSPGVKVMSVNSADRGQRLLRGFDGILKVIGRKQMIDHAPRGAPIEEAVAVAGGNEAGTCIEHLVLRM